MKKLIPVTLSPLIYSFANEMQKELERNRSKRGWEDLTPRQCLNRIKQEFNELKSEVLKKNPDIDDVVSECADLANFAAFLAWNISGLGK
jgi:NTP pyrophosphatase (non-canonical NTP hydrolase)